MLRRYQELRSLRTLEERYEYLALKGSVGNPTFGSERWMNQQFYTSKQWRDLRHEVIVRDNGCDLGVSGFEIHDKVIIHHMNPMTPDDIYLGDEAILNPDFLVCVSHRMHNAIHYGDVRQIPRPMVVRTAGDTRLW